MSHSFTYCTTPPHSEFSENHKNYKNREHGNGASVGSRKWKATRLVLNALSDVQYLSTI